MIIRSRGGVTMDLKAVGQRIKSAREAKNLTQEELAALVNLSPTHMRCNRERLEKLLQEGFLGNLNLVIRKANRM